MTGDNSHCTKTAHVKREGRESKEGKKKNKRESRKKKKKKLKSHTTPGLPWAGAARRCAGMRRDAPGCAAAAVPTCPAHTHTLLGCKNSPLGKDHPHPAQPSVHSARQGAPKHQGHPLEQHRAQRQVDGHRAASARGPSPGTVPIPPAQRSEPGTAPAWHTHAWPR